MLDFSLSISSQQINKHTTLHALINSINTNQPTSHKSNQSTNRPASHKHMGIGQPHTNQSNPTGWTRVMNDQPLGHSKPKPTCFLSPRGRDGVDGNQVSVVLATTRRRMRGGSSREGLSVTRSHTQTSRRRRDGAHGNSRWLRRRRDGGGRMRAWGRAEGRADAKKKRKKTQEEK